MSALGRISRARAHLIQDHAFFGVLALNLALVERVDVETMATDGISLFYAPAFVDTLTDAELRGVIAHETYHCALKHMARIGNRDLQKFNEAADFAINGELIRLCFTLPRGILFDPQFADMSAEEIYAARARQEQKPQPKQDDKPQPNSAGAQSAPGSSGQGTPQDGKPGATQGNAAGAANASGKPSHGQTNGIGGIMKPGDGSEAAAREVAEKWEIATRQAVAVAAKHAGSMPGNLARMIDELNAPRVDYRQALADFIDSRVSLDYSFMRPNRRFISAGFYLPGATVDGLAHLVFAVDTSGSITAGMIEQAAGEIAGALDDGKIERLTIVFADTDVRHVQEFERGDPVIGRLEAKGGGGTRFDRALGWIERNAPDATAVVYLTDMECRPEYFGRDPGIPVLWAIHGARRDYAKRAARAPFGECVDVGMLD